MAAASDKAGPDLCVVQEPLKVLFVDDDPILREFAVVNLAGDGVTIETAEDGKAALQAVETSTPDMLLLDLSSADPEGFAVIRALAADSRFTTTPVIAMTGREDVEAVEMAFEAGASAFVVKPLNWRLVAHELRYVRRNARRTPDDGAPVIEAAAKLTGLAAAEARFIARALASDPDLKAAALAFAGAVAAALKKRAPRKRGEKAAA